MCRIKLIFVMMVVFCVGSFCFGEALVLPDGTAIANRQDSGTGGSAWFGESVTTLTIDAQNIGLNQYVEVTGKITGISEPHSCWVEIGLIPKNVYDYWQDEFGGAWKSAVFNKGIYVVHWSGDGLGISLEENGSQSGPYAWPLAEATEDKPWEFGITMFPGGSGDAYLSICGEADPNSWGPPMVEIYYDESNWPFVYGGDYSECYLIAQIWSLVGNAEFSFKDVRARVVSDLEVDIDIKPGSEDNTINLGAVGLIPVAIFSQAGFDATMLDPDTVALSGAGVAMRGKGNELLAYEQDVNKDGQDDLVIHVAIENLDPESFQDGYAVLTGEAYNGSLLIEGSDAITIVPEE